MSLQKTLLYNGTVELTFDPEKHLYTVSGTPAWSVTTIIGRTVAKPALVAWSAKETAEYARTEFQRALKEGRLNEISIETICTEAKGAHRRKKEKAADIGSLVHSLVENYIKTGDRTMPVNEEAQKGFTAWLQWCDENKVEFKESETKIFSKKHNYAGTIDATANVNGVPTLLDLKTGSGIWDEYQYQLAAYEIALREEKRFKSKQHIIVNCRKDGTLETKTTKEFTKNAKGFLAILALDKRNQELKSSK